MAREIKALRDLLTELEKLPAIGRKSAQRIAFHLLKQPHQKVIRLAETLVAVTEKIVPCQTCFNLSETGMCSVCSDPDRESIICVVEDIGDIMAIERTDEFRGRYHVLGGVISPLDGIGPENLHIRELIGRVDSEGIRELIIATNFTIEGEATAMYLARLLKQSDVKVFRLAYGLPVGSSLEYADEATMAKALEGRKEIF